MHVVPTGSSVPTGSFGKTSTATGKPGNDCGSDPGPTQSTAHQVRAARELVLGVAVDELDQLGAAGRVVVRER